MKFFLWLFFFFLVFCDASFSQKKENDRIIEKINGVKYYIHSVQKGNTLYSVSKEYGVSIEDINKNNPEAANGLRIGQNLKIPVNKSNLNENEMPPAVIEGDYLIHEVIAKETLFSISKKYSIKVKDIIDINPETATRDLAIGQILKIPILKSQEVSPVDIVPAVDDSLINHKVKKGETLFYLAELYEANFDSFAIVNPGLSGELKENQVIRIPLLKKKPATGIQADSASKAAIVLKEVYDVALILPFHIDVNDSLERNRKFNEKPYIYKESEIALRFYEGAMLALDSLKKSGFSFRVHIFDSREDSASVAEVLKKPEMGKMDLIIGPLYQYLFKDVALFAKTNEIGIVCPVPQSSKILLENKFASKVLASPLVQANQLAEFVINRYQGKKILVFSGNEKTDLRLAGTFLQKAEEITEKQGKNFSALVNDYNFGDINTEKVKALLSLTDTNYIVLPSHDQVFVSDMLTKLNAISGRYPMVVFGIEKLSECENIDINYLHALHVHVACPAFINYENPQVARFNASFRSKYKTDPGKYGFLGFDVTLYYLSALNKYGKNYYDYLPEFKMDLLTNSFDFFRPGFASGSENKHVYFLKYENFEQVQVSY